MKRLKKPWAYKWCYGVNKGTSSL